jgi:hypothetical protein
MELGSYFLFLQEQIKDIIITVAACVAAIADSHQYNSSGPGVAREVVELGNFVAKASKSTAAERASQSRLPCVCVCYCRT